MLASSRRSPADKRISALLLASVKRNWLCATRCRLVKRCKVRLCCSCCCSAALNLLTTEALLKGKSRAVAEAELIAQGMGRDAAKALAPHKVFPGNRPSTLILLDALTPEALGGLIAMYEHSVYAQSVLWGINAFDQFGVELGKQLANGLLPALKGETEAKDPVTRALLAEIAARG